MEMEKRLARLRRRDEEERAYLDAPSTPDIQDDDELPRVTVVPATTLYPDCALVLGSVGRISGQITDSVNSGLSAGCRRRRCDFYLGS